MSNGALWTGAAVVGLLAGFGILAWISATDTHTGVGLGGYARWMLATLIAGMLALGGLVMCFFAGVRREGGVLLSAGGVAFAVLFLSMASVMF